MRFLLNPRGGEEMKTIMKNKYKVPTRPWRTWSASAQRVFNAVYSQIKNNSNVLFPASASKLSRPAIRVIAWNSAWVAADAVDGRCADE